MAIVLLILIIVVAGGFIAWRLLERARGAEDGSKAKLRGEILEIYCDAPYPPNGADYALVLRVALASQPPRATSIKGYRLETVCAGVPYQSSVLHDASYWILNREITKLDPEGRSTFVTEQSALEDLQKRAGTGPLPHNRELTGWLAFLFSGMFARRIDFQPPESFDVYRTRLVIIDSSGAEHRFSVNPNFENSGTLGQSPT
ncbi:MAG TPA: hypothetical protein VIH76_08045 [Candidatus Acidoferrales bacterium]